MKHSKLKNTGILYELIVRQLTSEVMYGKDYKSAKLIKEWFSLNKELGKELSLYLTLLKEKYESQEQAEKLIEQVLIERKKLNEIELGKQKYSLIKKLKETYNIEDFFKSRIDNYKMLASISHLFESSIGKYVLPIDVVKSKETILESITKKKTVESNEENIIEIYENLDADTRILTYKLLLEKFNNKYKDMGKKQKWILSMYINEINNNTELKKIIDKEVSEIKNKLVESKSNIKDERITIQLNEMLNIIDNKFKGDVATDDNVIKLLTLYELENEIKI